MWLLFFVLLFNIMHNPKGKLIEINKVGWGCIDKITKNHLIKSIIFHL